MIRKLSTLIFLPGRYGIALLLATLDCYWSLASHKTLHPEHLH